MGVNDAFPSAKYRPLLGMAVGTVMRSVKSWMALKMLTGSMPCSWL